MNNPILVLGCRVRGANPSAMLQRRLERALELGGKEALYVVSGRREAPVMRNWLIDQGIDARRVLEDHDAQSTNENLENARALLPAVSQWTVVTSDFHVVRTALWAKHLGIRVRVYGARTPAPRLVKSAVRECFALAHSVLRICWRRIHRLVKA